MREEVHVIFVVQGFGKDPSIVTQLLGLTPTAAWVEGDMFPGGTPGERRDTRWSFASPLPTTEPMDVQLDALVTLLEGRSDAVREASRQFKARIICAMYLAEFRGLNDEALSGEWRGHRSSRLNDQYRVIYRVEHSRVCVEVVSVTAHDYRRK
jgi:addiction module RelE/StbE family toxin